ncbi:hypothetical protein [Moorena producens]|uniref:hypothetical protein n=1 Tax=Moorena producens TaxID=1155739 RepID=UPI003C771679
MLRIRCGMNFAGQLNQLRECLFPVPYSLLPAPCSQIRCSQIRCSLCYMPNSKQILKYAQQ